MQALRKSSPLFSFLIDPHIHNSYRYMKFSYVFEINNKKSSPSAGSSFRIYPWKFPFMTQSSDADRELSVLDCVFLCHALCQGLGTNLQQIIIHYKFILNLIITIDKMKSVSKQRTYILYVLEHIKDQNPQLCFWYFCRFGDKN